MNYNSFQAEDFAADESFIAYYLQTDKSCILFWRDWISHHPEKIDEVLNAEQILAMMNFHLPEDEYNFEAKRFEHFLSNEKLEKTLWKKKNMSTQMLTLTLLAFLIGIISFVFYFYQNTESSEYITRQSGYGKILFIKLSDGTSVTLNSNSLIKFPKTFNNKKRDVFLVGEAFFEVAKDKSRPFSVDANGTRTTVLGTKFNVSAYKNRSDVKVALMEGKVILSADSGRGTILLKPSEMAVFSKQNKHLTRKSFDQEEVNSWRDGSILFHHSDFADIYDKLKNIYNIRLIDQSGKRNWSYSGRFQKTDYIAIIKSICFAENITFEQTDQTIVLKPKK